MQPVCALKGGYTVMSAKSQQIEVRLAERESLRQQLRPYYERQPLAGFPALTEAQQKFVDDTNERIKAINGELAKLEAEKD